MAFSTSRTEALMRIKGQLKYKVYLVRFIM